MAFRYHVTINGTQVDSVGGNIRVAVNRALELHGPNSEHLEIVANKSNHGPVYMVRFSTVRPSRYGDEAQAYGSHMRLAGRKYLYAGDKKTADKDNGGYMTPREAEERIARAVANDLDGNATHLFVHAPKACGGARVIAKPE